MLSISLHNFGILLFFSRSENLVSLPICFLLLLLPTPRGLSQKARGREAIIYFTGWRNSCLQGNTEVWLLLMDPVHFDKLSSFSLLLLEIDLCWQNPSQVHNMIETKKKDQDISDINIAAIYNSIFRKKWYCFYSYLLLNFERLQKRVKRFWMLKFEWHFCEVCSVQ